jgi:hypothetical protein
MEPGHIPDMSHGVVLQSGWISGIPVVRKFIGGIKYNRKANVPITAWRCSRCGYIELYAEGL